MKWECPECGRDHPTLPEKCEQCGAVPEVVLNRWRCQHCGTDEIPGTQSQCPTCRAARGLGAQVRVDPGSRLEGPRGLALARSSWLYCAYCDVQVPPVNEQGQPNQQCPECGGPLSEATREAASQTISEAEAGTYRAEQAQARGGAPAPSRTRTPPRRKIWVVVALVALALFTGLYFLFFHRWKKELTVADRQWQRTIEVERFGPVAEQAWQDEVPSGAYQRSCQRKVHHHDKVPDGTETYTAREAAGRECASYEYKTQGGASVKQCARWETRYRTVTRTRTRYRNVPIYGQHCRYMIDKWHRDRELVTRGRGKDPPVWPGTDALGARERAGRRQERYTLVLRRPDGKTLEHQCSARAEWDRFPLGGAVIAEVTTAGRITELTPKP
jgi:hypothetical protein